MTRNRQRRVSLAFIGALIVIASAFFSNLHQTKGPTATVSSPGAPAASPVKTNSKSLAAAALATLAVKGRAPLTGYSREKFGGTWADEGSCNMRDKILARDLTNVKYKGSTCEVASGTLNDPYTGKVIQFTRGAGTSTAVQIDHVVALGDTWQTGAQQLPVATRDQMYNDPLELLAVDGPANEQKGDADAASWLPSNKADRCPYVARQIAIKIKYHLWVTAAEHDTMQKILNSCPSQALPVVSSN